MTVFSKHRGRLLMAVPDTSIDSMIEKKVMYQKYGYERKYEQIADAIKY